MRNALVLGAILVAALLVRSIGFSWGDDFPGGFRGHHVDEWTHVVIAGTLINPKVPPRWHPQPYPKGLAAHVAVPFLVSRAATGRLFDTRLPSDEALIKTARAISIAYGVLAVAVLWWIARRLCDDVRAAHFTALCLALAPLAVMQSHFGLADSPALFWSLAAAALLYADIEDRRRGALGAAAFAVGMAVGFKLTPWLLPSLFLVAVSQPSRIGRLAATIGGCVAGFAVCTFLSMSPFDVVKCFVGDSVTPPDLLDPRDFPRLYAIEVLPSFTVPALLLAAAGIPALFRPSRHAWFIGVAIAIPAVLHIACALPKLAPFPRHLLPLLPALALLFGAAAVRSKIHGITAMIAVGYLAFATLATERRFDDDPRSHVRAHLRASLPQGATVHWPAYEKELAEDGFSPAAFPAEKVPDVIVAESWRTNHWLSGTGPRDSRPKDYRRVFDGMSAAHLEAWQALYDDPARFSKKVGRRFDVDRPLPEDRMADALLGDRSRTYVGDVLIFVNAR